MDIVLRAWPELLIRTQRLYKEATCRTEAAICQHSGGYPTTLPVQSVKFEDEDLDHRSCVKREDALSRAGWDITTITCPLAAHITGCNVHRTPNTQLEVAAGQLKAEPTPPALPARKNVLCHVQEQLNVKTRHQVPLSRLTQNSGLKRCIAEQLAPFTLGNGLHLHGQEAVQVSGCPEHVRVAGSTENVGHGSSHPTALHLEEVVGAEGRGKIVGFGDTKQVHAARHGLNTRHMS